jgi:hypothetical protein
VEYFERNFTNAIKEMRRAVELEDRNSVARDLLGRAYEANQQYDLALDQFELMEKLGRPADAVDIEKRYGRFRAALDSKGRSGMWQAMLDEVRNWQKPDPYLMAKFYARLGQKENAFLWLELARREHHNDIIMLLVDDWWDPLRADPAFKRLLREVGFLNSEAADHRR